MIYNTSVDVITQINWQKISPEFNNCKYPFDRFIDETRTSSLIPQNIITLFEPYLSLVDYHLSSIDKLSTYLSLDSSIPDSEQFIGLSVTCTRIIRTVNASKLLLTTGHEESARILLRSFLEDIELLLLMLFDKNIMYSYRKHFDDNEMDNFWYSFISKGKGEKKLKEFYSQISEKKKRSDYEPPDHNLYKIQLGKSVHSSPYTGFTTFTCPSLLNPGLFFNPQDHKEIKHSIYSYSCLSLIVQSIFDLLYIIITGISSKVIGDHIKKTKLVDNLDEFLCIYNVLVETRSIYDDYCTKLEHELEVIKY